MEKTKSIIYPCITAVVVLLLWSASIKWFKVTPYILPTPSAVGHALWNGLVQGTFYPHIIATLKAMLVGYFAGSAVAITVGAALAEWKALDRFLNPFIVAFQSMPKVALAPLVIVWFGFDIESKMVMVGLMCFFPVFVSTFNGIRAANADLIDLYRGFSASRMSILMNVKVPSAAGPIFSGLQIAVVMALIGAVVGEFIASKAGLGYLIQAASSSLDVATMFAAIAILSIMGVTASAILRYLHRRFVFWEQGKHTAIENREQGG